jgi:amino acid adenylation domain-containing protein
MESSAMPAPRSPDDIDTTLAHIVLQHAAARGDAIAVRDVGHSLTFSELCGLAAAIAARVDALEAGKGPVGILLPASCAYMAAILGLLARGIPYVPLDESFPASRNADIAARAGLRAVIVNAATAPAMREMAPDLTQIVMPVEPAADMLDVVAKPGDVAVIFYTSGSTGQPKGVHQSQRAILYEVLRHCWRAGLGYDDRIALLYSPSVSGSTRDIYGSLAAGAQLCVVDVRRQGFGGAAAFLGTCAVTVLHVMPGIFRAMFAADSGAVQALAQSVRLVHLISDRVLHADVALYRQKFSRNCRLCIDLATTETYSYASWYLDHDTVLDRALVPVGYPRADKPLRLVDDAGGEVANGELGEIVVEGRALSLGYWNDDALTRSRFRPSSKAGATEFWTGDVGRLLPDGLLEFIGRKDRQVKIRGNTVHLAEIEAALTACPGVNEAGVVARPVENSVLLAAYCAPPAGGTIEPAVIAAWCRNRLPGFMQPADVLVLPALPRLANGKPDNVALEQMDRERNPPAPKQPAPQLGMSTVMGAVQEAWNRFLQPDSFERNSSFENAGGDSLKGLSILLYLETRLGRHVSPSVLSASSRPSDLISKLLQPEHIAPIDMAGGRPLLFIFPGLYGADITANAFAEHLTAQFAPVMADFEWGGDVFKGTFTANAFFDRIVFLARQAAPRRLFFLGASYGGKLAAEAARRVLAAGLPVDGVIVVDGVRDDRFLRLEADARRGMLLTDRLKRGAGLHGGVMNYIGSNLSSRLAVGLAARERYGALAALLKLLSRPALTRWNEQARRGVVAAARLAAFREVAAGPIASKLLLVLSGEERFAPSAYPHLGWDACFDAIETVQTAIPHLGFFRPEHRDVLAEALVKLARV